jgi:uncharacterized RDD family membrane protein YckC
MYCPKCAYNNPAGIQYCKNCDLNLTASTTAAKPAALIHAGFWVRLLAAFLDILFITACFILFALLTGGLIVYTGRDSILHDGRSGPLLFWSFIFFTMAYHIMLESGIHSATLGKRWMNLKVLEKNGEGLTIARATGRFFARLLSQLLLFSGFLIQPFTPRKQALHDLLAGTIVVQISDSKKISLMASLLVLFFALMLPVLAFLGTAGMPFIKRHILKVQLENAMQTGRSATLVVAKYYRDNGRVPATIGAGNHAQPVSAIEVNQQNGVITLTFSDASRKDIRNKHLLFTPTLEADQSISWQCNSNDIEPHILPASCK